MGTSNGNPNPEPADFCEQKLFAKICFFFGILFLLTWCCSKNALPWLV